MDQMNLRKWAVSDLEAASGMLEVAARLDDAPPLDLAACFGPDYDGPVWPADLERPVLDGVLITFRVKPQDVVRYRDALRERLAAANRRYADVIVPRELARQAAERAREEERRRTISEAQRLFDLDPAFDEIDEELSERASVRETPAEGLAYRVGARSL